MSANIELLELIAELSLSDDKTRRALGAEIKRLTEEVRKELSALFERIKAANQLLYSLYKYLHVRCEGMQGVGCEEGAALMVDIYVRRTISDVGKVINGY